MCREYYIHKRRSGKYFVEFVNKATGKKLFTRSIRETKDKPRGLVIRLPANIFSSGVLPQIIKINIRLQEQA